MSTKRNAYYKGHQLRTLSWSQLWLIRSGVLQNCSVAEIARRTEVEWRTANKWYQIFKAEPLPACPELNLRPDQIRANKIDSIKILIKKNRPNFEIEEAVGTSRGFINQIRRGEIS